MNKYILFAALAVSFLINGCSKGKNNNGSDTGATGVSLPSISVPTFSNSSWNNVTASKALLQFDLLGQNNTVVSTIKDSVDLNHLSSYNKPLSKGVYNIYLSSKNLSIAADTFIRFSAQLKAYNVSSQQGLSLKVTSDDALITIDRNLVHDNTVPTFKPDTGSKAFKFGLNNGYYYLYVKGGIKGSIAFASKSNQTFTKNLSVAALNQYNVALQTANGSLQITFVPFAYNQVGVNSNTLISVNMRDFILADSKALYFVITDESGNIINETKYVQGTSPFKLSAAQPYNKDRLNFFVIKIPNEPLIVPQIVGFLQVKKGSVYDILPELSFKKGSSIKPHLLNSTNFDELIVSTGDLEAELKSPADTTINLQSMTHADDAKLYARMLKNNKYVYNFFDVPKGTINFNIDLTQLTKTPLTKTITAPANSYNLRVITDAKTDVNYFDSYSLDDQSSSSNQTNIYYPSETFAEYDVLMLYYIGNLRYSITTVSSAIPDKAAEFNASFNIKPSTLANFVPSWSGKFDFYCATFYSLPKAPYLNFVLYSPSAANYTNIKLPDFSKYLGIPAVDLNSLSLTSFGLYQVDGFDETKFDYLSTTANYSSSSSKRVIRNY